MLRNNKENDEFKKTIYSLKMREINTSKIVGNAENKIREQHEIREQLLKTIRQYENDYAEVSSKLKQKSDRLYNLKGKYKYETKKISKNLLNRSMMLENKNKMHKTVDIKNTTMSSFNNQSVQMKKNNSKGMNAYDYVDNYKTEISESSYRDSVNSVDIRLKEVSLFRNNENEIIIPKDSLKNKYMEMNNDKFKLSSSAYGSFYDKYLEMKNMDIE